MSEPIFINQLKGMEQFIAKFCDDGDGKLEEKNSKGVNEIGLFNSKMEDYRSGKLDVSIFNNKEVAPRDATYVAPLPEVALKKQEEANVKKVEKVEVLPKPLKLGSKSNIRTNYDWSEEEFAKVLDQMLNAPRYKGKFKNSVLQGKAKAFIEAGKKFNIDPRILVAVSMCESQRGISEKARKLNNVGGLRSGGRYYHFDSVEESIDSIAKTLNTRYQEGFTTPSKIAHSGRYCKKYAATTWLSNINSYLGFFDKYYDDDRQAIM